MTDTIQVYDFTINYYKYATYEFKSMNLKNEEVINTVVKLIEFNTTLQLFIQNKLPKRSYTVQNIQLKRENINKEEHLVLQTKTQQLTYDKQQVATLNAVLTKFISKTIF